MSKQNIEVALIWHVPSQVMKPDTGHHYFVFMAKIFPVEVNLQIRVELL